jgi:hypothetical protein
MRGSSGLEGLLTGAVGRTLAVRERAEQAQAAALAGLGLPSAADIELLARRMRSLSQRLEGVEDALERVERSLSDLATPSRSTRAPKKASK